MDLSTKVDTIAGANDGAKLYLQGPNGEPLLDDAKQAIWIMLKGKDSDEWIASENKVTNRRLQAGARMKLTNEGLKSDVIKNLAAVTVSWSGIGLPGEETSDCSYENAMRLYTLFPDVKDQAADFVNDRANFLKASSQT
jgi:hypothetical protein